MLNNGMQRARARKKCEPALVVNAQMLSNTLKALVVFTLIELLAFGQSGQKLISFLIFLFHFFIKGKKKNK